MKKIYLTFIALLSVFHLTFGQWTVSGNNAFFNLTGNVGFGTNNPTVKLQTLSGTSGSMAFPYETGVFEKNGDNKVGVLCSSSSPAGSAGASVVLGFTNYLNINSRYPGFEMQNDVYGTSIAQNMLLFTSLERNAAGAVVASNCAMAITGDGNVSIGTTSYYNYKLAVNGNAIATSMTVKAYVNWPDYVFKPAYHLAPLADVKTYIDQNQHLPEMPSAQEIEKEGLNLGEMNKLLLKKVEELTLYLIEKDKQIKDEALKGETQDDRIKKLEDRLNAITIQAKN